MASDVVPKCRVRRDNSTAPTYVDGTLLFTIEYHHGGFFEWGRTRGNPVGYGDGQIGYVDYCDPQELNYLSIVGMAANFGWMDVRFLNFKRVDSEFDTDIVKIEYDSDAKALGKFVDENKVVQVYCEGYYNDEGDGQSTSDDSETVEEMRGESDDFSDYVDSDCEAIGKEGEILVDIGVQCDMRKPGCANMLRYEKVDVAVLNEGFLDSDHFSEHGGSDTDEDQFILKTPVFAKTDLENVELKLGMRFGTADEFKDAIKEYSIQKGKSIKYKVQAKRKMYLYCANTNEQGVKCQWRMYCGQIPGEQTVQIKTYCDNHTYSRTYFIASVKPMFIAKKFLEMIRVNPKWAVKNFRIHAAKALEAHVSLSKAYRSLKIAKTTLQGTSGQQYEMLWDYCTELKRTNIGSTIEMKVNRGAGPNGESVFKSIYICWGAIKRGFLEGCRPLIGIDGTHLSGPHRGVLLTAIGLDANNCIYPIAYAVVGHETYKSWKWFIKLLVKDLNTERAHEYTFISDKQKGLIKAMEKIISGVEHRFCVWHLYNNFKVLHKGVALKNLLWKAARATTKPHFVEALEEMKAIDQSAYEWLSSKPGEHWSKSHFSTHPKCDLLLNNICESFNGEIKQARCKPILEMLEDIRLYLMEFLMQRKIAIDRLQTMTILCPVIANKLEIRENRSHEYMVAFNGHTSFEVTGLHSKFEVDIHRRECGCNSWQLSGIPCSHAIAALNRMGYQLENYVHLCYSKDVYKKTYSNLLMPINGKELWAKSGKPKLLPPDVAVIVGRPKKARRKGPGEMSKPTKLTKVGSFMKCGKCKKKGHNSRTCGRPEKPSKKSKKKAKLSETTKSTLVEENDSQSSDSEVNGEGTEQPPIVEGTEQPSGGDDFTEHVITAADFQKEWDMLEREEFGYGDDEHSEGDNDEEREEFNTQASGVTQATGNALEDVEMSPQRVPQIHQTKSKLPVRRSTRLMFSPKNKINVVSLVDLTVEGPSDGTMHCGIMKKPDKVPKKLGKRQIYKDGKIYSSPAAFKVALEHDRIARLKYGGT